MGRIVKPFSQAVVLSLFSFLLVACRAKPASVAVPAAPAPDAQAAELSAQGDVHFLDSHLYGWRKAEALYKQAYELQKTAAIREKLLLARFMIMTRQMDEDIPDPRLNETVKELCANPATEKDALLCTLAQKCSRGIWLKTPDGPDAKKVRIDRAWFGGIQSPVGAYLYSFCARADLLETPPEGPDAVADQFKDSPLFIYFDFARRGAQKLLEVEKTVPQFAELFDYMGEELFQKRRYNGARSYFRKALELIPEYTRSINGLGNIYSFALEDYEKAIDYYDAALKFEGTNTAALFGMGAALHYMGRYEESNATLQKMLQTDLTRKGYANTTTVRYYQGEGHHLQAYNHYLAKNPARARELVQIAKIFLPDSEEVNYLSGLLYYEEKNMEAARIDFLKVIQRGSSNCSAQHYLGLIYHERKGIVETRSAADLRLPAGGVYDKLRKMVDERSPNKETGEKRALNYFLGSCSCMDKAVRGLGDQIKMVPALDLEEGEKVVLKGKLEKKLFDYRLSSDSMIQSMMKVVSEDEIPDKQVYVNLMGEILGRIRLPAAGN